MKSFSRKDIVPAISLLLIFGAGFYGIPTLWLYLLLVLPFAWILPGMLLEWLVCSTHTKSTAYAAVFATTAIANLVAILFYNETHFIIGRLLLVIGVLIILLAEIGSASDNTHINV